MKDLGALIQCPEFEVKRPSKKYNFGTTELKLKVLSEKKHSVMKNITCKVLRLCKIRLIVQFLLLKHHEKTF